MTKLAETVLAGSTAVATALSGVSHAQTQSQPVKNILFRHREATGSTGFFYER